MQMHDSSDPPIWNFEKPVNYIIHTLAKTLFFFLLNSWPRISGCWRMWGDILRHGTQESWVQLHFMDLTRENGTCHGRDGPTRFEFLFLYLPVICGLLIQRISPHEYPFMQVGLKGEAMNLVSPNGISSVDWMQGSLAAQRQQPLTWHKVWKKGGVMTFLSY